MPPWPHGNMSVFSFFIFFVLLLGSRGSSTRHCGAAAALPRCSLNSGCAALHNVIRRSQETPQGLFNLLPHSLLVCGKERLKIPPLLSARLFVTYPCQAVATYCRVLETFRGLCRFFYFFHREFQSLALRRRLKTHRCTLA